MKKSIVFFLVVLLLIQNSYAATIYGSIYDTTFSVEKDVLVKINTSPAQKQLSKNGDYEFEVAPGNYKVTAEKFETYAEENITIVDDGIYVIDLFLFPVIEEDPQLRDIYDLDIYQGEDNKADLNLIVLIVFLLGIAALAAIALNKKVQISLLQKDLDLGKKDLEKVVRLLEKNNGRMTQKEMRKHFAKSEAKISLMIAELESMGKIKKVRKGRGNILILEKFK